MAIGTYGDVAFEVSSDKVRTFQGFKRTGKARWASHELAQEKPVLQYLGPDVEEVKFSMQFSVSLGVNPRAEMEKLRKLRDAGEPQTLTIGGQGLGKWALESLEEDHTYVDNRGNVLVAAVAVSLKEYREREDDPKYRQGLSGVSSLNDQAVDFGENLAESAKGVADVPDEAVKSVTSTAEEGGGFREKLSKAATRLQEGATLTRDGLRMLDLAPSAMADLGRQNPVEAVSTVLGRASSLPTGMAREAMTKALGSEMAEASEKYLGRAKDFTDTARSVRLAWLQGVNADRSLGDVSTARRAASVADKVASGAGKLAYLDKVSV